MFRYWQAYLSIKDTVTKYPFSRHLSAVSHTTQIRLSVLAATISTFIAALIGVLSVFFCGQFDKRKRKVTIPLSQYDWVVQTAREVMGDKDDDLKMRSPSGFQEKHDGKFVLEIDELERDNLNTVAWIKKTDIVTVRDGGYVRAPDE